MTPKLQKFANRGQDIGSQTLKKWSFFFDKNDSRGGQTLSGLADEWSVLSEKKSIFLFCESIHCRLKNKRCETHSFESE
jgi:hypothetical protein